MNVYENQVSCLAGSVLGAQPQDRSGERGLSPEPSPPCILEVWQGTAPEGSSMQKDGDAEPKGVRCPLPPGILSAYTGYEDRRVDPHNPS